MKKIRTAASTLAAFSLAGTLVACGGASSSSTAGSEPATADAPSADELGGEFVIRINTDGAGEVSFTQGSNSLGYGDSAFTHANAGDKITMSAREKEGVEGFKFVKWTKNGADFSTDETVEVTVDGDAEYVAVFEFAEE